MENKNLEAIKMERLLLGTILVNGSLENIVGYIEPADFSNQAHSIIFKHIMKVGSSYEQVEIEPVIQSLRDSNEIEKVGGENYLGTIINSRGLNSNITQYIKTIVDKSQLRKISSSIEVIKTDIKNNLSPDEVATKIEIDILSLARNQNFNDFESAEVISKKALSDIEDKMSGKSLSGLPSDFKDIDEITGGFQRGDLIILAARPSMGKTAFAINIAANIAVSSTVAFFSIEMPKTQIMNRIFSLTGAIEGNKIRVPKLLTDNDKRKLYLSQEKASKLNLFIDDSAGIKLTELVWKIKRLAQKQALSLVVIDYLQLITVSSSNSDNRQNEVSLISRTLKKLARELSVPIIALSQLSRRVEQRESKVPMMSDLRESGAIEQDADLIAFLYREDYYKNKDTKELENDLQQQVDIIIGKHRNGATGKVSLIFNPKIGLFIDNIRKGYNGS